MFKWQTGNTDMTNLLQLTISLQKSHQNQHTLQPTCKGRTFFIWADIHISSCGQQHPKCEPAIRLMYPPLFCKLHSSSNPTNKNLKSYAWGFKQLYLSNQSELDGHSCELFFSQWLRMLPPTILTFPLKSPSTTDFMLLQLSVFTYIIKVTKYIFVHHVVSSQLTTLRLLTFNPYFDMRHGYVYA